MDFLSGISLAERMVSAFPLSIGTSLAFESVFEPMQKPFDPDRKVPNKVNPADYDTCYINLQTLYRNMVGALDKNLFNTANVNDLIATMLEEIGVIQGLFDSEGQGCIAKFYHADHSDLRSYVNSGRLVGVKLREPNTDNQKFFHAQEQKCLKALDTFTDSILKFKDTLESASYERALVVTHHPYDLIHYGKFKQIDLLESNTGVLKPRYAWSSKYHQLGEHDLSHLPFCRKLLLVFGDKTEIKPGPLNVRNQVYEVSKRKNWNPLTTMDKINLDLQVSILDPAVAAMLRSYN